MHILRNQSGAIPRPCVATIGFFDGVHRGHRFLIEQVRAAAGARGLSAAVVTFPVHPYKVMHPDFCPELLTTCDEKLSLLADAGLDTCVLLSFTPEIAALSARGFMIYLQKHFAVCALVVGYDHRFGHNRREGFDDYVRYGKELGMEVILASAYVYKNIIVSSSVVRHFMKEGDVSGASACLGYDFFLDGTVVGGYRVGRTIGFPTANIQVNDPDKMIPADSVYAVRVQIGGGELYKGMLSIGCRPTLNNGGNRSIEVNILHFNADIYDEVIRVFFVRRIRSEQKFNSLDKLIAQLHQDAEVVEALL